MKKNKLLQLLIKFWWVPFAIYILANLSKLLKSLFSNKTAEEEAAAAKDLQKSMDKVTVPSSGLNHSETELEMIMNNIYTELCSFWLIQDSYILDQLDGLEPNELDWITKKFGVKAFSAAPWRPTYNYTLFQMYDYGLSIGSRSKVFEIYKNCLFAYVKTDNFVW